MKVVKSLILILIVSVILFSCKTKEQIVCENAVTAKLVNKTIDGCTWLIELEDGQILEPLNLKEFDIEKIDNKKIWITYEDTEGYVSICMMGPIVRIKCISERKK
ncbi:MAG: hypothetical protein C0596_16310 [Marinilabiliales bacterium]|nr:MAG: hypothetical protein C0596_16310 [Marinilabiliales bacterium]